MRWLQFLFHFDPTLETARQTCGGWRFTFLTRNPPTCESRDEALSKLAIQPKKRREGSAVWGICTLLVIVNNLACQRPATPPKKIEPTYNRQTGRLELLRYDSDGDGKFDTFSYMDGARILRIEIDQNEDGTIDRWEYYGPDRRLEKIGFARARDGVEDAWSFFDASGATERIEISTKRNRTVDRVEHYANGALVRAEEDGDGDGRFDKWETYDGGRLASVAFDTVHRGTPDRRLIYGVDGSARVEVDLQGSGVFVAATPPASRNAQTPR
jgi:hypothetical protein